ncbi:MAG: FliH/SctL family protein [Planctomycetaceae bacterium]|nr:FliH/SctL family protein [Planctomycetaceae bacterium]
MSSSRTAQQNPVAYNLVPFNFVDLEEKATSYLAQVKAHATQVVADARNEVERVRQTAAAEWKKSVAEVEQTRSQARVEAETIRTQLSELRQRLQSEEDNFKTRKEQLEAEAIKLKAQLKENEDAARRDGYDEGRLLGYEEGHSKGYTDGEMKAMIDYADKVQREAAIQLGTQLETLLPALKMMIDRVETAKQSFLQQWERSAINVAEAIAAKAIDRQLPEMIDVPIRLLREALELGTGSTSIRIRLNHDDYEALRPQIDLLIHEMTRSVPTEIVGDISVSPGGCILETPQGTIDNRIETRVARIEEELCLVDDECLVR